MKKIFTVFLALALALSLAACSGSKMEDGVYTAQMAEPSNGYRDTLVVEYKDGKMVAAEFESYNVETGARKSEVNPEEYPMDPAPADWIPQLSANILKGGEAKKIDTIAGATYASTNAKTLLAAIEKDGKPGETIDVSAEG